VTAAFFSTTALADDMDPQLRADDTVNALIGPKLTGTSPNGAVWVALQADGTARWGDGSSGKGRLNSDGLNCGRISNDKAGAVRSGWW
jgi:hypothetical protein